VATSKYSVFRRCENTSSRPQGRIRFGSRVDDARMSCGCGVDKMRVDILFHLKDVVTSATDDVESAIIRFGRVCHVLGRDKQKRKKAEKPTFEDGSDGFGEHRCALGPGFA
jgi:hypothetical protein